MAYTKIDSGLSEAALQKLREKSESNPLEALKDFAATLDRLGDNANFNSIEAQLIDYTSPPITNRDVFKETPAISLLEYLRDHIIPTWPDKQEIKNLLIGAINDVLNHYYDLMDRRNAGIAA